MDEDPQIVGASSMSNTTAPLLDLQKFLLTRREELLRSLDIVDSFLSMIQQKNVASMDVDLIWKAFFR